MKNNSIRKYIVLAVFGFVLLLAGLVLVISLPDVKGIMLTLPYICVGVGTGIFGGNLGAAISNHLLKKDPNLAKQKEIDTKDERNIAIGNKAKAFDLMLMVYSALMIAFALMQIEMYVVLILAAAYLFVVFSMIFYLNKYNKEM